ncbi:MAG: tail fiber domain-containing protein [Bacteroidetes bacterium]|nr:tail fiber domain-containing protein [Bacteroidota bacterium]
MKTTKMKSIFFAMVIAGAMVAFNAQGQTKGSGGMTNSCTSGANDGGVNNTSVGCGAGAAAMSGTGNSSYGYQAGTAISTGSGNSFFGHNSGNANTSGAQNIAVGLAAGFNNATGNNNTSCGYGAGQGVAGNNNSNNSFFGYKAGNAITTGGNNCFVGYQAGLVNTIGFNTFIGSEAGLANTSGGENVFMGYQAADVNTTGADNCIVGFQAGNGITTATHNVVVGAAAGQTPVTNGSNTIIGYGANVSSTTWTNDVALGNSSGSCLTGSNQVQLGNTSTTTLYCGATSITSCSDRRVKNNIKENIPGLAFINLLKPVSFNYDIHKMNNILGYPKRVIEISPAVNDTANGIFTAAVTKEVVDTSYWDGKYDKEKITYSGLIAQQVDSAAKKINYDFSGVVSACALGGMCGLNYSDFVVPLIKAVQELSHKVDSLSNAKSSQRTMNNDAQGKNATVSQIELANNAMLYQNAPNPFGDGTTIKYFVSDNSNAQIIFLDEFGNKLKEFKVEEKGMGQLNVSTVNLSSGFYSYSLIINGKVVDTKKMIKNN